MVQKAHISIVLDRSGSMDTCRTDAVDAVNSYLRQMRQDKAVQGRLSLVTFDSQSIDTVRDRVPLTACPPLTLTEYEPRAATPLLDAVGYAVGILDCLSLKNERRIMAIMTDGLENASREYTRDRIKNLLDRKQREDGWLVLYLGAGHDSWSQAAEIGVGPAHAADFLVGSLGETANVLHAVGKRYLANDNPSAAKVTAFSDSERRRLKGERGRPGGTAAA
jgi:hypothetical protein